MLLNIAIILNVLSLYFIIQYYIAKPSDLILLVFAIFLMIIEILILLYDNRKGGKF